MKNTITTVAELAAIIAPDSNNLTAIAATILGGQESINHALEKAPRREAVIVDVDHVQADLRQLLDLSKE